jgi:hypothetical protein
MSKYGAVRTNGYASKREAARAMELKLLEHAGVISDLKEQVAFELIPKQDGERAVSYKADFTYVNQVGEFVCEDVKGCKTPEYIIKRKLLLFIHHIKILETR